MTVVFLQIWYPLGFGYRQLAQKISWHYLKNCGFFLMSIFWWSFLCFFSATKTEKLPLKVRQYKKIYNFWDCATNFFVQVVYTQNPKHAKFEVKIQTFSGKINWWNSLNNVSPYNYATLSNTLFINLGLFAKGLF